MAFCDAHVGKESVFDGLWRDRKKGNKTWTREKDIVGCVHRYS